MMVALTQPRTMLVLSVTTLLMMESEHLIKCDLRYWSVGHQKIMMNSMKGLIVASNHDQQEQEEDLHRASWVQPHL